MLSFPLDKPSVWERMAASALPLALYGTGDGADKILAVTDRLGLKVQRLFVSDDFFRGQTFRGLPASPLSALEEDSRYLVLLAFGSHRPEILQRVRRLARRHSLLIPDVPVCGDTLFDRDFILRHREELARAYELFEDEASRRVFRLALEYKFTGEPETLFAMESCRDEVFSDLLPLGPREHYLDLGAYRGDTVEEFLAAVGGCFASITALEPDPRSFRKLQEAFGTAPGITLLQQAIGRTSGIACLRQGRGRGSVLSGQKTDLSVACTSVDDLDRPVTYLKMDLEGTEAETLESAARTLAVQAPMLNVACYHRSEDLFRLPLLISSLQPRYRLFLRRHPCVPCWDLNLYARPR